MSAGDETGTVGLKAGLRQCSECGAVVKNWNTHEEWHRRFVDEMLAAVTAFMATTAPPAANLPGVKETVRCSLCAATVEAVFWNAHHQWHQQTHVPRSDALGMR